MATSALANHVKAGVMASSANTYDQNDRLTQQGSTFYTYDANGNTLTESGDGGTTTYTYNAKNKLTQVDKGSITSTYAYNVDGIRVAQTVGADLTRYVVDSHRDYAQVIAELDASDAPLVHYTYGDDLISQERAGAMSYYHYDGLGSTRALSDDLGNFTDGYDYAAFGELLNSTGSTENTYLYTGEQFDASLDQYYLRARYYDQGVGRFTQLDTWMGRDFDPITLNKYVYGNVDPTNTIDPSGNSGLLSLGAASNIRGRLATMSTPAFQNLVSRALWGEVKEFAAGQITQAAFGVIGEHVVSSMVNAVDSVAGSGKNASGFGSTAHKRLQEVLDDNAKKLNKYLRKFNARVETEIFMLDDDKGRTGSGGKKREKGSMGLDVIVTNTKTGKTIFAFDLKTGKTGTSKKKLPGYQQRFNGAPIIDVFIRRK